MRKLIVLFILTLSTYVSSQNCFFPFQDQIGYRTASDVQSIEQMACKMRDSIPARFRDDFGVFDFGYYHLNEFMPDAYNTIWNQEIQKAKNQKPFYLFIARIYSNNSSNKRVKVELVFPQTEVFDCITNEQIQFLEHQIATLATKNISISITKIYSDALKQLTDFIADKKICCNPGNRSSCGNCIKDESFMTYLTGLGYKETKTNFIEAIQSTDTFTNVKEYAKIKFTLDGSLIDVNQTITEIVQDYKEISDNVTAEIHLYNNTNCDKVFKLIESETAPNSEQSFFKIKVIGVESIFGDKIFVKLESNFFSGKGTGTLYVLNGSSFNTTSIISKTQEFFSLAGLKLKLKQLTKNSKIGDTDGWTVIGKNKQKVVDLVFGTNVLNLDLQWYDDPQWLPIPNCPNCQPIKHECKQTHDIKYWPVNDVNTNPERSVIRGVVVDVSQLNGDDNSSINYAYSNNNDDNKLRKPGGTYRSIAFLILHGTAHQAGFHHNRQPEGQAYCMDGEFIADFLGCSKPDCQYTTYEKLIELAKKDYIYMIGQTNIRYGY